MSEVIAALLGALVAGLLQTITTIINRKRRAEATLTAIACEVDSICRLVRHQQYLENFTTQASAIVQSNWTGVSYVIDVRSDYFSVYNGTISDLSLLTPYQIVRIVNFYAYCKSAIDSTRPDGVMASDPASHEAAANVVSVAALLKALLGLGDEIVQLPKASIQTSGSKKSMH